VRLFNILFPSNVNQIEFSYVRFTFPLGAFIYADFRRSKLLLDKYLLNQKLILPFKTPKIKPNAENRNEDA